MLLDHPAVLELLICDQLPCSWKKHFNASTICAWAHGIIIAGGWGRVTWFCFSISPPCHTHGSIYLSITWLNVLSIAWVTFRVKKLHLPGETSKVAGNNHLVNYAPFVLQLAFGSKCMASIGPTSRLFYCRMSKIQYHRTTLSHRHYCRGGLLG